MAVSHISFNDQAQYGRPIRRALDQIDEGRAGLIEVIAILQRMIDGNSSQASQFTYMKDKCGFASNEDAKAAWEELNSLAFKLTTDDSQSNVSAALLQAFSKLG